MFNALVSAAVLASVISLQASTPASRRVPLPAQTPGPSISPSLEATEEFIKAKVGEQGRTHITGSFRFEQGTNSGTYTIDIVGWSRLNFDGCKLVKADGEADPAPTTYDVTTISAIEIITFQDQLYSLARSIHPDAVVTASMPANPPGYVLQITAGVKKSGDPNNAYLYFRNHNTVASVAKAFAHLVDICTGGKKPLF